MDKALRKWLLLVPLLYFLSHSLSLFSAGGIPALEDDAFFYLKIADNAALGRGLSFDGLTVTNGFHPLWMLIVLGIRTVSGDPLLFLRLTSIVSAFLMSACMVLFLRNCKKIPLPLILLTLILLLRYARDFAVMSMETSVMLVLAFCLLIIADGSLQNYSRRRLWLTGAIAGLMVLARLDSVLLAIPVLVLLLKRTGTRGFVPLLVPGLLLGLLLVMVNLSLVGEPFSVSGMMKAAGPGWNSLFAGQLFRLSDPLGARSPWGLYLVFLILSIPLLFLRKKPRSAIAVSVFITVFTMVQLFASRWRLWYWYAYPSVLFAGFGLPFLLGRLFGKFDLSGSRGKAVSVALFIAAAALSVYWGVHYGKIENNDFRYRNMIIAQELNLVLPDSAVVAVGDRAGSFAYFFHGHVIQAEGLAGDAALVEAIKAGGLQEYLQNSGCNLILSWTGPHRVDEYECWELTIPDPAQCQAYGNSIAVKKENEIYRWPGEDLSVFLWRLNENL